MDANGRVSRLEIETNRLRGVLPAELGNRARLSAPRLSRNELERPIPAELANLCNPVVPDFAHIRLSGNLPTGLGIPTSLRKSSLAANLRASLGLVGEAGCPAGYGHCRRSSSPSRTGRPHLAVAQFPAASYHLHPAEDLLHPFPDPLVGGQTRRRCGRYGPNGQPIRRLD